MPHVGSQKPHFRRKIAQPSDLLLVILLILRRHAAPRPSPCCARNHPLGSMVPGTYELFCVATERWYGTARAAICRHIRLARAARDHNGIARRAPVFTAGNS